MKFSVFAAIGVLAVTLLYAPRAIAQSTLSPEGDDGLSIEARIDWVERSVSVTMTGAIDPSGRNAPIRDYYREQEIQRMFPSVFFQIASGLALDSRHRLGELWQRKTEIATGVRNIASTTQPSSNRITRSLSAVELTYVVDMIPRLFQILRPAYRPSPVPLVHEWEPSDNYTGILIMAQEPLPVRGEERPALLQPALLPEIFDAGLNTIASPQYVDPSYFYRWGVLTYTTIERMEEWTDLIGANPLRIVARELFGTNPTDIILSERDARRILSTAENRRLITEGRVLVIINPDVRFQTF